ncbi:EamA family transporter [Rhodocista pekingensis]|uniref:EamA family transporter n=1 Tax=Rhodocista pekingensis TaxID=201185 RepID=A0ABW2KQB5_9PROT
MKPIHISLAILCAAIWGFVFVVIDWGLSEIPPLLFTALRFAVCAAFLPFIGFKPPVAWRYIIGVGISLGMLQFGLYMGMAYGMPAGLASLVNQTQAFFTVMLAALWLGDRPSVRQLAGIAVAFLGIAVIAADLPAGGTQLGLMLCVVGAMFWAVSNVLMKVSKPPQVFVMMIWMSLIPPIPLCIASYYFEGPQGFSGLLTMSPTAWFAVFYSSVIATILGFGLWGYLLKQYTASIVAPFSMLVPVFGIGFAVTLLGEELSPVKLGACGIILAGLALTLLPSRRPPLVAAAHAR